MVTMTWAQTNTPEASGSVGRRDDVILSPLFVLAPVYEGPTVCLSTLYVLSQLITLDLYHDLHFTDKETEARVGKF